MKSLTKRQAIILFALLTISSKLQRLPALISSDFGRDGYIAFFCLLCLDFLLLLVVGRLYVKLENKTVFEHIEKRAGKFWLIVFCVLTIIFFLFKSLLSFKQLHEFFANTLFNRLPWNVFSVLFIALLILMVGNGLKNIGRNGEFYVYIMTFCLLAIVILGVFTGDYQRLLPILDISITDSAPKLFKYSGWFLDPIAILFFAGNVKEEKPKIKGYVITQIVCGLFIVFGMATFYAVNEYMVDFQTNGLTSMTEFTLIRLGVGRPDWFLVLIVNISNVIVSAFLIWVVVQSLVKIINKSVNYTFSSIVLIVIYLLDEFVYKNLETTVAITTNVASYYMLGYCTLIPLVLFISLSKCNNISFKEARL